MKHFLPTTAAALALAVALCSFAPFADQNAASVHETSAAQASARNASIQNVDLLEDDDQDPTSKTGEFRMYANSLDGYIYFSIDGVPIRMLEKNFPKPIPANGTIMTATGLTKDSDGGYTCTGLS